MQKAEIIQILQKTLEDIPYRDIGKLTDFLVRAELLIKSFSGNTSQYRADIKLIRFSPWSQHAGEKDFERSWESGKKQVASILKAILDNPTILVLPTTYSSLEKTPETETIVPPQEEEVATDPIPKPEPVPEFAAPPEATPQPMETTEEQSGPLQEVPAPVRDDLKSIPKETSPRPTAVPAWQRMISLLKPKKKVPPLTPEPAALQPKAILEETTPEVISIPESLPATEAPTQSEPTIAENHATVSEPPAASPATDAPAAHPRGDVPPPSPPDKIPVPPQTAAPTAEASFFFKLQNNKIFFVHSGTANETMRERVVKLLKKWELVPFFSLDRFNFAKPITQKLMENSDIQFAIVLLTPDGYYYDKDEKPKDAKLRPQQNVTFEMGYLMGKLGRNRVFVLYPEKKNFELPTQFFAAIYTPFDKAGHWEEDLQDRLKSFGYSLGK